MEKEILYEAFVRMATQLRENPTELLSRNRKRELVDARSIIAAKLKTRRQVRQQDIANLFGISQAAVSKLLVRHSNLKTTDRDYLNRWESLNN